MPRVAPDRGIRPCFRWEFRRSSGRIGRFGCHTIRAQREIKFGRLALVLQAAAWTKIRVVVEIVERRVEDQLLHVLGMQRSIVAPHHGPPRPADQRDLLHVAGALDVVDHRFDSRKAR